MSSLPSTYQNIYYVYKHICPETGILLYIGQGSKGRAWVYAQGNLRNKEHDKYLMELTNKGFTSNSWVHIVDSRLSKSDSLIMENLLVWDSDIFPLFNSKKAHCCKLTEEDLLKIKLLRDSGLSYEKIADETLFSTMTIFRALTNRTKNYAK